MSKTVLLIFFCHFCLSVASQPVDLFIKDICNAHHSFKETKNIFHFYEKNYGFSVVSIEYKYPPFADRNIEYEISYNDSDRYNNHYYILHSTIFYKEDKILYMNLIGSTYLKITKDTLLRYVDTSFTQKIIAKNKYPPNCSLLDPYEKLPNYFGVSWGMSSLESLESTVFKDMENVFLAILVKDSLKIIRLCHSFSSEQLAYGATGLYLWGKFINPLDRKAKHLFKNIEKSSLRVAYGPGGCMVFSGIKMSEAISKSYLSYVCETFGEYKKEKSKSKTKRAE